jgi:sRNA-binding carbon storage regulator CsrA
MSTIVLGKNDAIVIGNEIIVTVLAVRDDEV